MTITTIIAEFPWPSKALHKNGRAHWAVKAKEAKKARQYAWAATLEALMGHKIAWNKVNIQWTFHPKTKHPIDDDGAISSVVAYRDGIADALGIDDRHFVTLPPKILDPVKGGAVIVTIMEGEK